MEDWCEIVEFPGYSVSSHGRIRNDRTRRIMVVTVNQRGIVNVGLVRAGDQYKRSVAVLVAQAFLSSPGHPAFDTPIHLDGDRLNNHVSNLMWRPRWFAVKYHQQFSNRERGFPVPVVEVNSGERFRNSWEAALKYGLIDREIAVATLNHTYVWPTYQIFELLE